MPDRSSTVTLPHDTHLVFGFGNMGHEPESVAACQLLAPLQRLRRTGIGRMGRHGQPDTVAVARGGDHPLHIVGKSLPTRIQIARSEHGPDAEPPHGLGDTVFVPIHIDERRDAAQQHFDNAHFGSQHDFVRGLLRLERPDIFVEPLHQGDVVGIAPLEGHRHVAVGIDQSRHEHLTRAVDLPRPGMLPPERFDPPGIGADQRQTAIRHTDRPRESPGLLLCRHGQNRTVRK